MADVPHLRSGTRLDPRGAAYRPPQPTCPAEPHHAVAAPPTASSGSRATSSAPTTSRASSTRRCASRRCPRPTAASATNGRAPSPSPARSTSSSALYDVAERGHGDRLPRLLARTTRPRSAPASRPRATNAARGAHGADRRDVGGDQRRLARAAALRRHDDGPRASSRASSTG